MSGQTRTNQPDLFAADMKSVPSFENRSVRAATLGSEIAMALSEILKSATSADGGKLEREDVARRMGDYLGKNVSPNVLNAYASQAREGHNITVARLCALMHATGDFRLLKLLAEKFDLTLIPRKYETAVRESMLAEEIEHKQEELQVLRRRRGADD